MSELILRFKRMHFDSYELCIQAQSEMYSQPLDLECIYAPNNKYIPYRYLSLREFLASKLSFESLSMSLVITNMIRCLRVKINEK